jgi:hypothetical protein
MGPGRRWRYHSPAMARQRLPIIAGALIASAVVVANQSHANARPACFGGTPQVAAAHEDDAADVAVSGRFLTWSAAGRRRMDLATSELSTDPSAATVKIDRDRFEAIAPLQLSPTWPPVSALRFFYADANYFYYHQLRQTDPTWGSTVEDLGLFRAQRTGARRPEVLARAPGQSWYDAERGSIYYLYDPTGVAPALMRRALVPGAQAEIVQHLDPEAQTRWLRRPIVRVVAGYAYFVHDEALWSAPIDGGAPPTRRAELGRGGALDVLVEGGCLYWATERTIGRVALDSGAPRTPEVIADYRTFQPTDIDVDRVGEVTRDEPSYTLATDGRFLYWPDRGGGRIMRAARASRAPAPAPPLVAASFRKAAIFDAPPPSGTTWAPSCGIHSGCPQPTPALPACAARTAAVPWSKLEAGAKLLGGKVVTVSGPLTLGTIVRGRGFRAADKQPSGALISVPCRAGECCRHLPRPVEIGGGRDGLKLQSLECRGDDSRVCCPVPAFGQTVVATGTLAQLRSGRWMLTGPQLCVR